MDRVRAWNAATGSPGSSWSIVLDVSLEGAPGPGSIASRLERGWVDALGPVPAPRERAPEDLQRVADGPYRAERSLVRVASDEGSVLLAAHHSVLDGLGLLALLALVLDEPVASSARGLEAAPAGASALRRAADLARRPAARLPGGGRAGAHGDHLRARACPRPDGFGTRWLVAAAVRAVREAAPGEPVLVAVAASTRPGSAPTLEDASAFLRVRPADGTDEGVAAALAAARPEGGPRRPGWTIAAAGPLLGPAARRVGASLLVSNLGLVTGPGIRGMAFYPAAGGRSGVAVGAAGTGEEVTVTVRMPRSAYSGADAERLLDHVAGERPTAGGSEGRA